MARLVLSLLGAFRATLDGEPVTGFQSDKVRALLAYLAVEAGQPQRRATLAGLLWPDRPDSLAHNNLRQVLFNLRQVLGDRQVEPPFLLISREAVEFNLAGDYWLDVAEFTTLLQTTHNHAHSQLEQCPSCLQSLERVAALYRGEFLSHFFLRDSTLFEEWALLKREQLHQQAMEALTQLTSYHAGRGDTGRAWARRYAMRQVELEPWREEAHCQLMRLLALSGQRSAALAQYDRLRRQLSQELGVEPAPETRALYIRIRDGEQFSELPHRAPHYNLPVAATPLIGREIELDQLSRLLAKPACRLVSLTGPGGIGKTRLAMQLAAELADRFNDGVVFVSLATVSDPHRVAAAIAQALALVEAAGRSLAEQVITYLRDKHLLLALDNFEQVIAAATIIADLLAACPSLKIVVTSREVLRLQGEHSFPVPPLALPNLQHGSASTVEELAALAASPAVALFIERVQAHQPTFRLTDQNAMAVGAICVRLDGLPLAIELATAHLQLLSPQALLERLDNRLQWLTRATRDAPARHQTLRAAIAWSYEMLNTPEQRLFRYLAVFVGGFTFETAEKVIREASLIPELISPPQIWEMLLALVDKSLLMPQPGPWSQHEPAGGGIRFRMLETIREFAWEQLALEPAALERLQRCHADYFLALAEQAEPKLLGAEQLVWLNRLEREHDNFRAALAWALPGKDSAQLTTEIALRLAGCLGRFWLVRGYLDEGRRWLETGLAALADGLTEPAIVVAEAVQAKALLAVGILIARQYDHERARELYNASLALYQKLEHRPGIAYCWLQLGILAITQGDLDRATELGEACLRLYQALADQWGTGYALLHLGTLRLFYGEPAAAQTYLEEALKLFREVGELRGLAITPTLIGLAMLMQGQVDQAKELLLESLTRQDYIGDKLSMITTLSVLAGVAAIEQQAIRGARLLGAAEALREAINAHPPRAGHKLQEFLASRIFTQLDEAFLPGGPLFQKAWAEGHAMTLQQALNYAVESPDTQVSR
jgi:predicted ATPase/DNA-binding SARP family transcriptional activator